MSDSLITIVAIFLAAILMFVFPLMSVAERTDDITQMAVQTAASEFVDSCRQSGSIDWTKYNNLISKLSATGDAYNVDIQVDVLDGNNGKKSAWTSGTVIGENVYYSLYTTQILDEMSKDGDAGKFSLKEGDLISVKITNTNTTLAQSLRSIIYSIAGNGSAQITAQAQGMVTANSKD